MPASFTCVICGADISKRKSIFIKAKQGRACRTHTEDAEKAAADERVKQRLAHRISQTSIRGHERNYFVVKARQCGQTNELYQNMLRTAKQIHGLFVEENFTEKNTKRLARMAAE